MRSRITYLTAMMTLVALGAAGCVVKDADTTSTAGTAGPRGDQGLTGDKGDPGDPGASADERSGVDAIPLFGENFFPEGVASRADGTLYVGSLGTGEIVQVPAGKARPVPFVDPGALGMVGLLVDDATDTLWACAVDISKFGTPDPPAPGALRAFNATTGEQLQSIPYSAAGFCNDMTLDDDGNLYVTDSFAGVIQRLPVGGTVLEPWSSHPLFATPQGEFGLNGIAYDNGAIYVAKTDEGAIFRVPIEAGGVAGTPLPITFDRPLVGPDGMKRLAADTLLVVDNAGGAVVQVKLSGTDATTLVLRNFLDTPTTAAIDGLDAWVAEGQFDHLFGSDPSAPNLPFMLRRVYLP